MILQSPSYGASFTLDVKSFGMGPIGKQAHLFKYDSLSRVEGIMS